MNTDRIYTERLASEYAVKDTSKVTALVLGMGMCLSMRVIGSGTGMRVLGIILGLIGFIIHEYKWEELETAIQMAGNPEEALNVVIRY